MASNASTTKNVAARPSFQRARVNPKQEVTVANFHKVIHEHIEAGR